MHDDSLDNLDWDELRAVTLAENDRRNAEWTNVVRRNVEALSDFVGGGRVLRDALVERGHSPYWATMFVATSFAAALAYLDERAED